MSKMKGLGWLTALVGIIGLLVFSPVITFGFAWMGGWILKVCVGSAIADGMNLMFNTSRFTPDFIPLACATLATIGKYFKSSQTNNNKSERS
jgi:hypothetical protein